MKNNYAFIDSQNLNLSIENLGWRLDFGKFRIFLRDKYRVEKAFLFLGKVAGNEKLYKNLCVAGFELIFKPTVKQKGIVKGNCDAELVLHSAKIEFENYEKAVVVSGDGDFHCLIKFLISEKKLLKLGVPNRKRYSSLLSKFWKNSFFISDVKHKFATKKDAQKKPPK